MGVVHFGRALIDSDFGNMLIGFAIVGLLGWFAASLWAYWWQFRQIRQLDGPLFEITSNGLVDHWAGAARFLSWDEMESARWTGSGAGPILCFTPKHRDWIERHIGSLGFRPFHYPAVYFEASAEELAAKICELAPKRVWK
ncbi:MAG: hypothetical protein JXQ94_01770 [Maricaulis maris]